MVRIKIARSARRHKMSKTRILTVMADRPAHVSANVRGESEYHWIGEVDGFVIEVVAVEANDDRTGEPVLLVLHSMPGYRK